MTVRETLADPIEVLSVKDPQAHRWDEECDVLVVGFGGAGAVAALEARAHKADVLILERFEGGGATAISGNIYYAGGGTRWQKQAGIEDTVEDMFAYLKLEVGDAVSEDLLRQFCERSVANMEWIEGHGVQFGARYYPQKTSYPNKNYDLYHSGSELVRWRYARPSPRGHKGLKAPNYCGKVGKSPNIYAPLARSALGAGARLFSQTRAIRLIVDQTGKVLGVEARRIPPNSWTAFWYRFWAKRTSMFHPLSKTARRKCLRYEQQSAQLICVRARRGVILASGGFITNSTMVAAHAGPIYNKGLRLGTMGCDGSGIRMGQGAGGAVRKMESISAWRFINPPAAWSRACLINRQGERFCCETLYGAAVGAAIAQQEEAWAALVMTRALARQAWSQLIRGRAASFQLMPALILYFLGAKQAPTLPELAKALKVPHEALEKTLNTYTLIAQGKQEDPFEKSPEDCQEMTQGPWVALNVSMGASASPCPVLSLGGLEVDEADGRVINTSGQPIEALYAVGRNAVGVASNSYMSGLSIADCVFSGRRAGAAAAKST